MSSTAAPHEWDKGEHEGCGVDSQRALDRFNGVAQGSPARGDVTLNEDQAYHLFLIADTAARNERGKNKAVNHLRELLLPAYRAWHDANPGTAHPALSLPSTQSKTGED